MDQLENERVARHTPAEINRDIVADIRARLRECAAAPDKIDPRLNELNSEWDIERVLETNASSLAFVGIALGATVDRRWLALPALVTAFLFQHAVQGWCPPVPVLRRLGFRTAREIELERYALKALRGDFSQLDTAADRAAAAFEASAKRV